MLRNEGRAVSIRARMKFAGWILVDVLIHTLVANAEGGGCDALMKWFHVICNKGGSNLAPPELYWSYSSLLEGICRLTGKAYQARTENLCSNFLMIKRVQRF